MSTVFTSKHLISEVTGQEIEADADQIIETELSKKGVLSLTYYSKDGLLKSRISLKLSGCKAVEAFTDSPESKYFQIRADGAQIPVILTKEECGQFMQCVDNLLGAA
jgi:hypothetical protein